MTAELLQLTVPSQRKRPEGQVFGWRDRTHLAELHEAAGRAMTKRVDVEVLLGCAEHAIADQSFEAALCILQGALVLEPDHPRGWALAGEALSATGCIADAQHAFVTSLMFDDESPDTALSLSRLYVEQGDFDRGQDLLTWLISTFKDDTSTQNEASELLRRICPRKVAALF